MVLALLLRHGSRLAPLLAASLAASAPAGPCTEEPVQSLREEALVLASDVLERAGGVAAPRAVRGAEAGWLPALLVRDLTSALLRVVEAVYAQVCRLSGCEHCGEEAGRLEAESGGRPAAIISERLLLVALLFDSAADLAAADSGRRQRPSPLPSRRAAAVALRAGATELRASPLLEKLVLEQPSVSGGVLSEWVTTGRDFLSSLHSHTTEALLLVAAVAVEAQHLPGVRSAWGHTPYFEYLQQSGRSQSGGSQLGFMALLQGNAGPIRQLVRSSPLCEDSGELHTDNLVSLSDRSYRDASGARYTWHETPMQEVLEHLGRIGYPLSNAFWTVRAANQFGKEVTCEASAGIFFDPALCLEEQGWGGLIYFVNPDPTPREKERLYVQWRPRAWNGERSDESPLWKGSLDPVTPPQESVDILVLSPLAGNCALLSELLTADPTATVRIIYAPINPVIPPPLEAEPNFTEFWLSERSARRAKHKDGGQLRESAAQYTFAQCSLESVCRLLRPFGYELLHVEHTFAVFVLRSVALTLRSRGALQRQGTRPAEAPAPFEAWRRGWFCSPLSRYVMDLEVRAPFDPQWLDPHVDTSTALCAFSARHGHRGGDACHREQPGAFGSRRLAPSLASGSAQPLRDRRRVLWATDVARPALRAMQLLEGPIGAGLRVACGPVDEHACVCVPPYRGSACAVQDASDRDGARPYRAAIAYVVEGARGEELEAAVAAATRSLASLWTRFNARHDYPVLLFHWELSASQREQIVLASACRVWFFDVSTGSPAEARVGFAAGELLRHPVVASFDFLWALDVDSHFPTDVLEDPLLAMHRDPALVLSYRRLATLPAGGAVSHRELWDHTLLYLVARDTEAGLGPHGTGLFAEVAGAPPGRRQPEWNRKVVSTDCEVLRLDFFRRRSRYADYLSFVESHWHSGAGPYHAAAVRTLGAAVAARLQGTAAHTLELGLPYAWRDFCDCGHDWGARRRCAREPGVATGSWQCVET